MNYCSIDQAFNGEIVYSKNHEYTQEKNLILQNIKKGNIYYSDN